MLEVSSFWFYYLVGTLTGFAILVFFYKVYHYDDTNVVMSKLISLIISCVFMIAALLIFFMVSFKTRFELSNNVKYDTVEYIDLKLITTDYVVLKDNKKLDYKNDIVSINYNNEKNKPYIEKCFYEKDIMYFNGLIKVTLKGVDYLLYLDKENYEQLNNIEILYDRVSG